MKAWFIMVTTLCLILGSYTLVQACEHEGACSKACSIGPHFLSPKNGDTVSQDVNIKMGMTGMKVQKAGELVKGTGHHHLIIDGAYVPENETVPKDDKHIHFGKGQTETTIKLSPGKHTLTLQFADGFHQSYGKIMSQTIEVIVK